MAIREQSRGTRPGILVMWTFVIAGLVPGAWRQQQGRVVL
jgi:hypothetical protein